MVTLRRIFRWLAHRPSVACHRTVRRRKRAGRLLRGSERGFGTPPACAPYAMPIDDVTARECAVADLASAEELFRGAFDGSPIGIALVDGRGVVLRVNAALRDLTGRADAELTGARLDALVHPDDSGDDRNPITRLIGRERDQHGIETRFMHVTGPPVSVTVQATMIRDAAGAARRLLVQVQDVSHRRRYEESLHHLATRDPLTGLHNRASFARQLDAHADLVRR